MKAAIETERQKLVNSTTTSTTTERGRILIDDSPLKRAEETAKILSSLSVKISMVMAINDTSMMISIQIPEDELSILEDEDISILYTLDKNLPSVEWTSVEAKVKELFVEGSDELHTIISGLVPGKEYFFKAKINNTESAVVSELTKVPHDHLPMVSSGEERDSQEDHGVMTSAEEAHDHSGPTSGEVVACTYKNKMFAAGEEFYDGYV